MFKKLEQMPDKVTDLPQVMFAIASYCLR